MPIRIEEAPDPLSGLTPTSTSQPILAESDAYRLLVHDMERYVLRRVTGRSFLISGHRGSGKTTLVLKAVHDLRARFRGESEGRMPLLVRLTGPDLLPDPKRAIEESRAKARQAAAKAADGKPEAAAADDAPAAAEPEPEVALAERALRQITLAIYRALATEFSRAYGEAISESIVEGFDPFRADVPLDDFATRRMELAAQFRLALDDAPGPALLRELYRLGGFLASGVLFRGRSGSRLFGQGLRELVVLASAAQAYRVVSGDYATKQTAKANASDEIARSLSVAPSGAAAFKDLARQLLALSFGGAVGAGVFFGEEKGLAAALAAVAAAGVASFGLKLTSSRSRKRAFTDEYTFIRSHDASTLERELPVLVERLHDAGLAPIFLVDELDKVDDLAERMESVVNHLKHFVSEGAFFCFLTDRDYFEHLFFRALREPYPREHTYFTHRLFVVHRPDDWHAYLDQTLQLTGAEPADLSDAPALRYYLLHQARMHPVDLRRELRSLRGPTGDALLRPGEVRSRLGCRLAVTAQLAVELVLTRGDVKERLEQEPAFAQPMFDALYYPSRMWAEGGAELDVSKAAFVRYLSERMSPNRPRRQAALPQDGDEAPPPAPKRRRRGKGEEATKNAAEDGSAGQAPSLPITEQDVEFLLARAQEVAALLADTKGLADVLQGGVPGFPVASEVIEAIPVPPPEGAATPMPDYRPLETIADGRYRWRFDAYGIALPGTEVMPPLPAAESVAVMAADGTVEDPVVAALRPEVGFIKGLDDFIRSVSRKTLSLYKLADELFILRRTPSWPQVETVLGRLDRYFATRRPYPDLEQDRSLVVDYVAMVLRRAWALELCLSYGAYLGRMVIEGGTDQYLARGVRAISQGYDLRAAATDESVDASLTGLGSWMPVVPPLGLDGLAEWATAVRGLLEEPTSVYDPGQFAAARTEAWKLWEGRLRSFLLSGTSRFPPERADLLCLAAGSPAEFLPLDLSGMTLFNWTNVLHFAAAPPPEPWLAVSALVQLGLGNKLLRGTLEPWLMPSQMTEWIALVTSARPRAWEPRPNALVRISARASVAVSWEPSERYGAVVIGALRRGEMLALFSKPEPGEPPSLLLIEVPVSDEPGLERCLDTWGDRRHAIFLLAGQESDLKDVKLPLPNTPRTIIGAKSLDEAMERALRLLSESPPPPSGARFAPGGTGLS